MWTRGCPATLPADDRREAQPRESGPDGTRALEEAIPRGGITQPGDDIRVPKVCHPNPWEKRLTHPDRGRSTGSDPRSLDNALRSVGLFPPTSPGPPSRQGRTKDDLHSRARSGSGTRGNRGLDQIAPSFSGRSQAHLALLRPVRRSARARNVGTPSPGSSVADAWDHFASPHRDPPVGQARNAEETRYCRVQNASVTP